MKFPPDDVKVGDVLILMNGERGKVVSIIHDEVILDFKGKVNENEDKKSKSDIVKWVSRGKWKLIRRA